MEGRPISPPFFSANSLRTPLLPKQTRSFPHVGSIAIPSIELPSSCTAIHTVLNFFPGLIPCGIHQASKYELWWIYETIDCPRSPIHGDSFRCDRTCTLGVTEQQQPNTIDKYGSSAPTINTFHRKQTRPLVFASATRYPIALHTLLDSRAEWTCFGGLGIELTRVDGGARSLVSDAEITTEIYSPNLCTWIPNRGILKSASDYRIQIEVRGFRDAHRTDPSAISEPNHPCTRELAILIQLSTHGYSLLCKS